MGSSKGAHTSIAILSNKLKAQMTKRHKNTKITEDRKQYETKTKNHEPTKFKTLEFITAV